MRIDARHSLRRVARLAGLLAACLLAPVLRAEEAATGEELYRRVCADCHDKGATNNLAKGSPKIGDRRAWESRVAKGFEPLYRKVTQAKLHGKEGDAVWEKTNPFIWREDLSDQQIRLALKHMFDLVD